MEMVFSESAHCTWQWDFLCMHAYLHGRREDAADSHPNLPGHIAVEVQVAEHCHHHLHAYSSSQNQLTLKRYPTGIKFWGVSLGLAVDHHMWSTLRHASIHAMASKRIIGIHGTEGMHSTRSCLIVHPQVWQTRLAD